jgi:hypothetical protein
MVRNFLFHRVSPERDELWDPMDVALFEKRVFLLSLPRYHVMLMEDFILSSNTAPKRNIATISFDDGYKDKYSICCSNTR